MTIKKDAQILRSLLQEKVLKSKEVTIDELAEFATVAKTSGRLADRVLFSQAKRFLNDSTKETESQAE